MSPSFYVCLFLVSPKLAQLLPELFPGMSKSKQREGCRRCAEERLHLLLQAPAVLCMCMVLKAKQLGHTRARSSVRTYFGVATLVSVIYVFLSFYLNVSADVLVPGDMPASPDQRVVEDPLTPVFYNLYIAKNKDVSRVKSIANEQFALLRPAQQVFIRSVGVPVDLGNATTVRHDAKGSKMETLGLLWRHCQSHADDKVVYIHSKGSFHDRGGVNGRLRQFLTRGALSKECSELPATCNVCSSRFSPVPHPHTPGNMWLARCHYVQKLMDPLLFEEAMNKLVYGEESRPSEVPAYCIGRDRWSAEH